MFDKHVHVGGGSQSHYHTHNITEKRAPTDESVRLLKEFEKEALDKVLSSVRLENCPLDCVIHRMRNVMSASDLFLIQYRMGGKEVRVKHEILDGLTSNKLDQMEQVATELRDELARSIAQEMLSKAFQTFKL